MRLSRSEPSWRRISEGCDSCRLCLRTEARMLEIFTEGEASEQLRSRIRDCCPIELVEDDALPKVICAVCERKIAIVYEFREQCRDSERKLRQCHDDSGIYRSTRSSSRCRKEFQDVSIQTEAVYDLAERTTFHLDPIETDETESTSATEHERKARTKSENNDERTSSVCLRRQLEIRESSNPVVPPLEQAAVEPPNDPKKQALFLCDVCSKTFASESGLRFHLKSHDGAKPHLCRYCGKGFVIPSYAKRHERVHQGDKRFVCHVCSASFSSSNGFKYHLRSHTGEANYRCETCGKSFGRYKYLKEHIFTHTGERPFVCKICSAAYGSSGSLFVHEKKCKARCAP